MKRGVRVFGVLAALLMVAVVLGLLTIFGSLGSMLKSAIEEVGSATTGTAVTLEQADFPLSAPKGTLRTLIVPNPEGFKSPHAFRLGEVSVVLTPEGSDLKTTVVQELVITAPEITYETGTDGSNIDAILRQATTEAAKVVSPETGSGRPPHKFVIQDIRIRGGTIVLPAPDSGRAPLSVALPDLHMKGIGADEGGVVPARVVAEVLANVSGAIVEALEAPGDVGGQDNH